MKGVLLLYRLLRVKHNSLELEKERRVAGKYKRLAEKR
jgi:hypothetical protein